jgi:hypothetical protein
MTEGPITRCIPIQYSMLPWVLSLEVFAVDAI